MGVRFGLLAFLALLGAAVAQAGEPVGEALDSGDPMAVEATLAQPAGLGAAQTLLLQGALAAMRFDDLGAVDALGRALNGGLPAELRRRALSLLGGVQLRANNYAAAAEAFDASLAMDTGRSPAERLSLKQTRDVAFALRGEAPQTHDAVREGSVEIDRDMARLARADGLVNGTTQEFVLDTGAGYSTVRRSTAERLKLRFLPGAITVGSATAKAVPAQLAVADSLEIAGNRFRNVVFLVMEDEALSFGPLGIYTIDAILGFPVLARLGRIEFAVVDGDEFFRVATGPGAKAQFRDLYLDVLRPVAIVDFAGAGRIRMMLDSGAKSSSLNGTFAAAFPALVRNAPTQQRTFGGAGGSQTVDIRVLRDATISIDGRARKVDSITVSAEEKDEHGALGQDILRAEGGFALDFRTMDFVFLPSR
jgi:predicted aspartyl protease